MVSHTHLKSVTNLLEYSSERNSIQALRILLSIKHSRKHIAVVDYIHIIFHQWPPERLY